MDQFNDYVMIDYVLMGGGAILIGASIWVSTRSVIQASRGTLTALNLRRAVIKFVVFSLLGVALFLFGGVSATNNLTVITPDGVVDTGFVLLHLGCPGCLTTVGTGVFLSNVWSERRKRRAGLEAKPKHRSESG